MLLVLSQQLFHYSGFYFNLILFIKPASTMARILSSIKPLMKKEWVDIQLQ